MNKASQIVLRTLISLILLSIYQLISAQEYNDSYEISYHDGNMVTKGPLVSVSCEDEVISSYPYGPPQNNNNTVAVLKHDRSGKLIWSRKLTFEDNIRDQKMIVANDVIYIIGIKGDYLNNQNPKVSLFTAMYDLNGKFIGKEQLICPGSFVSIQDVMYNDITRNLVIAVSVTTSVGTNTPTIKSNIIELDKFGKQVRTTDPQLHLPNAVLCIYTDGKICLFNSNAQYVLELNGEVTQIRNLNMASNERFIDAININQDSILIHSQMQGFEFTFSSTFYIYTPENNRITEVLSFTSPMVQGFKVYADSYLFYTGSTSNASSANYYQFDRSFKRLKQKSRKMPVISQTAEIICGGNLFSIFNNHPADITITKSEADWTFIGDVGWEQPTSNYNRLIDFSPSVGAISNQDVSNLSPTSNFIKDDSLNLIASGGYSALSCYLFYFQEQNLVACNDLGVEPKIKEIDRSCLPDNMFRSYLWGDGTTTLTRRLNTPGWHTLKINEENCVHIDSVYVDRIYASFEIEGPKEFCKELDGSVNLSSSDTTLDIYWNHSPETARTFTIDQEGQVYAETILDNGCTASASIYINERCDPLIYIPDTFTPDGDGYNDIFKASMLFTTKESFTLHSKWGEKIFESNGPECNWDGTIKGKPCPDGVYIWALSFLPEGLDKVINLKGTVLIVR